MKKYIVFILSVLLAVSMSACGSSASSSSAAGDSASSASQTEDAHSVQHGELLSWNENDLDGKKVLVVKAKISPSLTNALTIDQNYMNVADIIQNQGGDAFDEIQYWAVADMTSGSESKVVSFTLDDAVIKGVADGSIVDIELGDYAADLYIHPSFAG